jgi:hypothetical protein
MLRAFERVAVNEVDDDAEVLLEDQIEDMGGIIGVAGPGDSRAVPLVGGCLELSG